MTPLNGVSLLTKPMKNKDKNEILRQVVHGHPSPNDENSEASALRIKLQNDLKKAKAVGATLVPVNDFDYV